MRKSGDEDRAVDADLVHRRHHLVSRDVIGPVRHTVPGSLRSVRLIGMDLGIDNCHRGNPFVRGEFGHCRRFVSRAQRRGALRAPAAVSTSQDRWSEPATRAASRASHLFLNFRNFACQQTRISSLICPVPSLRGALRDVTDVGRDAVDAAARGRAGRTRTAKSCRSDAPMPASSLR